MCHILWRIKGNNESHSAEDYLWRTCLHGEGVIPMEEALIFSLIVGISVGFSAGYLGSIMVLEKMALVGDALSHVALPGLALGVLLGFNPLLGGFIFLFVSAILIWHLGRVTKLSFETLVGAAFTLALAIGIIMYGKNLDG